MSTHETASPIAEINSTLPDIPKSQEIFAGDINDAVITVQKATGYEITPEWWSRNVGNDGSTEEILKRFDTAFEVFVQEQTTGMVSERQGPDNKEQQALQEANEQMAQFDELFKDDPSYPKLSQEFIIAPKAHLEQKYFEGQNDGISQVDAEMVGGREAMDSNFNLTTPESRTYSPYEDYRFLVHVALQGVEARADEIGSDRDGRLLTSLVSNKRSATFNGEGGIIVAQPSDELVTGVSSYDVGGENLAGTREPVENLLRSAGNSNYTQIDMHFGATKPVGVMIKRASTDGHELGSAWINRSLREYAERNELPIAEVIVLPDEGLPEDASHEVQEQGDGSSLLTITLPDTNEQYYKLQVLRGEAYHTHEGESTAARTMRITAYGETTQAVTQDELNRMLAKLRAYATESDGVITDEDVESIRRDALRVLAVENKDI